MLQTAARMLVKEHVGGTPTDVEVIDWGNKKRIAVVTMESGDTVVVCQESKVLDEALVSERMSKADIVPVPDVLWADPTGEEATFPTYIQQYVDASFLPRTPDAYRSMGRTLATLHSEMLGTHAGPIEYEDGELVVDRQPWPESFKSLVERIDGMATMGVPPRIEDAIESYIEENEHLLEDRPIALCHQDMHPHNVLADGDEIKAIIDWDRAEYQDPEADLALAEYLACDVYVDDDDELRAELRTALYEGYQSVWPLSDEYFTGRRSLYRLPSLVWGSYKQLSSTRQHSARRAEEELRTILNQHL